MLPLKSPAWQPSMKRVLILFMRSCWLQCIYIVPKYLSISILILLLIMHFFFYFPWKLLKLDPNFFSFSICMENANKRTSTILNIQGIERTRYIFISFYPKSSTILSLNIWFCTPWKKEKKRKVFFTMAFKPFYFFILFYFFSFWFSHISIHVHLNPQPFILSFVLQSIRIGIICYIYIQGIFVLKKRIRGSVS